jgi:hypothetical protein
LSRKCGNLDVSQPFGPVRPVIRIALIKHNDMKTYEVAVPRNFNFFTELGIAADRLKGTVLINSYSKDYCILGYTLKLCSPVKIFLIITFANLKST